MTFLLTHIENGQAKDLPQPVKGKAITEMIDRLLETGLIESVHISLSDVDDEIIFVKG